jgi:hypothetical protein
LLLENGRLQSPLGLLLNFVPLRRLFDATTIFWVTVVAVVAVGVDQ